MLRSIKRTHGCSHTSKYQTEPQYDLRITMPPHCRHSLRGARRQRTCQVMQKIRRSLKVFSIPGDVVCRVSGNHMPGRFAAAFSSMCTFSPHTTASNTGSNPSIVPTPTSLLLFSFAARGCSGFSASGDRWGNTNEFFRVQQLRRPEHHGTTS